jgi:hypothetical protein
MIPERKSGIRNRAIPFLRAHFTPAAFGDFRQEVSHYGAAVRDVGLAIANVGYAALRFGAATCRIAVTGTGIALKSLHTVSTQTRTRGNLVSYATFAATIPLGVGLYRNWTQDAEPDFNQILGDGVGALILLSIAYSTGPGSVGNNQVAPNKQITLLKSILREALPIRSISYLKDPEEPHAWRWLLGRFLATGTVVAGSYGYLGGYQAVARKWSLSGGSLLSYAADRSSGVFRPYRAVDRSLWEFIKAWVSNLAVVCLHDGIPVVVSMVVDYVTMSGWAYAHGQAMPHRPNSKDFKMGLVPMFAGTLVSHLIVSVTAKKTSFGDDKLARMVGHLLRLASRSGARYLLTGNGQYSDKNCLSFFSTRDEHVSLAMDFTSAAFMHRWGTTTANKFVEGLMMENIADPSSPAESKVERKTAVASARSQHYVIRDAEISAETSRDVVIVDMTKLPPHYGN